MMVTFFVMLFSFRASKETSNNEKLIFCLKKSSLHVDTQANGKSKIYNLTIEKRLWLLSSGENDSSKISQKIFKKKN